MSQWTRITVKFFIYNYIAVGHIFLCRLSVVIKARASFNTNLFLMNLEFLLVSVSAKLPSSNTWA